VGGVLFAETAVFAHFQPVRVILFILHCVVISLLALGACQCNLVTHGLPPKYVSAQLKKAFKACFLEH
jgi:hypothetical protein